MDEYIYKFEEARIVNPQATIDGLLAQSFNQAQTIHSLSEQNQGLLSIEELDKLLQVLSTVEITNEETVSVVKKLSKLKKDLSPTPVKKQRKK